MGHYVAPEKGSFRVPAPRNRSISKLGSPTPTARSKPRRAVSSSMRSSTVPPRLVADEKGTRMSPVRKSYQNVQLKIAQSSAEAGEFWLADKDGEEPWPVVICDEDMITSFFGDYERPQNARRPDGTWHKTLGPRGDLAGKKCFPAMYLGTWKFCWVPWHSLNPLDVQMAPVKIRSTSDENLKCAYTEAIEQWGNHNIQYWKDKLMASRLQEGDVKVTKTTKTTKRKFSESPTFRHPFRVSKYFGEDNVDDDEGLFGPVKKEPKDDIFTGLSFHRDETLYDNSGSEELPRSSKARKIGKSSVSVSRPLTTPPTTPAKSRGRGTPKDLDKVTIYVGNPHRNFVVKRGSLEERSPFFSSLVSQDRAQGSYIMSPLLSTVAPEDFKVIAEFLDHGEYQPYLIADGTDAARLENVNTNAERAEQLHLNAIHYRIGQQFGLSDFQMLVFRKVKALGFYPALELLSLVNMIYRVEPPDSKEMHEFFFNHLADCFYDLMREDMVRFVEMLEGHPELARCVFKRLSLGGRERVKDEIKGEAELDEPKSDDDRSLPSLNLGREST